jgi:hypothetical protein
LGVGPGANTTHRKKNKIITYHLQAPRIRTDSLERQTLTSKLQLLQNSEFSIVRNSPKCTSVCDLHTAFSVPYVSDYRTKLCRQQARVIQNHENDHVRIIAEGEERDRKYKRLKLGGGQAYSRSSN